MNTSQHFIAQDYLHAFDLKSLFIKYTVIYSQLHYPDGNEPLSAKNRHDLGNQLQDVMNEMNLLVLNKKNFKNPSMYDMAAFKNKTQASPLPSFTAQQATHSSQWCN